MQQSNVIFASLFIAFIVFITVKGELPNYINILKGNVPDNTSGNVSSTSSNTVNDVVQGAENLLSQSPGIQINAPAPPVQ